MSLRRQPNANRNFPEYCPYCAGTQLFPDVENDDPDQTPAPAASTAQALRTSLRTHGHKHVAS